MKPFSVLSTVLAFCAVCGRSQTTTTTLDHLGETVVQVISIDPVQRIPVTQTISTLNGISTSTTGILKVRQQGPVGQPPATLGGGGSPTPYTYTTTDAAGNVIAVEATFTPSFVTTGSPSTPPSGSILDYSSWRASIGTNTVALINGGTTKLSVDTRWVRVGAALCVGLIGGTLLVVA